MSQRLIHNVSTSSSPAHTTRQDMEILRTFFESWAIEKDVDKALLLADEDIFMMGIMNVTASTREELRSALTASMADLPEVRSIVPDMYAAKPFGPELTQLIGTLQLRLPNDTFDCAILYRFSATLTHRGENTLISALHFSLAEKQPSCPVQPFQLLREISDRNERSAPLPANAPPLGENSHYSFGPLESFYNTMVDGIAKMSGRPEHRLLFANRGFYTILGYTEAEFHQLFYGSMESIIHPVDLPSFLSSLQLIDKTRPRCSQKLRLMRKNLSWIWVRLDLTLSEETDGRYPVFFCFCTDIDDQEAKEREYQRQNSFLSLLATEIDLGALIVLAEKSYPIVYLGDNMVEFLGYDSKEEISCTCLGDCPQIIHGEDWKEAEKKFARQLLSSDYIEGEFRVRKKNGLYRWVLAKGRKTVDEDGTPIIIFLWTDISRRKDMEQDLRKRAQIDQLTGIYNRISVEAAIQYQLQDRRRTGLAALFVVDMDNFKNVNDTLGHLVGDEVLISLAQILLQNSREDDIVGRLGGDEFVIFMSNIKSLEFLEQKAEKISRDVCSTFSERYPKNAMSVSIGIATTKIPANFDELYLLADKAMYKSKGAGKNTWRMVEHQAKA